jgi:hypothetical protein
MRITEIEEKQVFEVQTKAGTPVYIVRAALLMNADWSDATRVWICQCEGFRHVQKCKHLTAIREHLDLGR